MLPTHCATPSHEDRPILWVFDGRAQCVECAQAWTQKRKAERLAKERREKGE